MVGIYWWMKMTNLSLARALPRPASSSSRRIEGWDRGIPWGGGVSILQFARAEIWLRFLTEVSQLRFLAVAFLDRKRACVIRKLRESVTGCLRRATPLARCRQSNTSWSIDARRRPRRPTKGQLIYGSSFAYIGTPSRPTTFPIYSKSLPRSVEWVVAFSLGLETQLIVAKQRGWNAGENAVKKGFSSW